MTSLAMTIFCFPLILISSILVLNGWGGGWLELRFPSVGIIPCLYTRRLLWGPHFFFQEFRDREIPYIGDRLFEWGTVCFEGLFVTPTVAEDRIRSKSAY